MEDDSTKEECHEDGDSKEEGYKQGSSMESDSSMENNGNNADGKRMVKRGYKKDYKDGVF